MNVIPTATKVLVALSIFLASCGSDSRSDNYVPPRPDNLPEKAEWRGDLDGGNWVSCERSGEIYTCSTYWTGGEIYSRQSFRLCVEGEATRLFEGHDLSGLVSVDTVRGTVRFVPTAPAEVFTDGQLDEALTAKVRSDFEAQEPTPCPVELVVKEDLGG